MRVMEVRRQIHVVLRIVGCMLLLRYVVGIPSYAPEHKAHDLDDRGDCNRSVARLVKLSNQPDDKSTSCRQIFIDVKVGPCGEDENCASQTCDNFRKGVIDDDVPKEPEGDIEPTTYKQLNRDFRKLDVRAVYYVPRPIGMSAGKENDLYSTHFNSMHVRDLAIIANVLQANTIVLDPWDLDNDHSDFLKLCEKNGLFAIPSFDLRFFFEDDEWKHKDHSRVRLKVMEKFEELIRSVKTSDPVLMWTINHALLLNETVANGHLSKDDKLNNERDRYFDLVAAIRNAHYTAEWRARFGQYLRPLALPIHVDSAKNPEDISWYVGFAETEWSQSKSLPHVWNKQIPDEEKKALQSRGLFDVWLPRTMQPTDDDGVKDTIGVLQWFNATPTTDEDKSASYYEWRDQNGNIFPDCADGGECTYPTQKAVLLQFGFAALQETYELKLILDTDNQQARLKEVSEYIAKKKWKTDDGGKPTCASGVVVDEWVDDWDRCALARSYPKMPYRQSRGGACDMIQPGRQVHFEWFGIFGQYSLFGFECIDPRSHSDNSTSGFSFDTVAVENSTQFSIRQLCRPVYPDQGGITCMIVCLFLIFVLGCWRRKHLQRQHMNDEDSDHEGTEPSTGIARRDSLKSGALSKISVSCVVEVPKELIHKGGCSNFGIELNAVSKMIGKSRFTKQMAEVLLKCHVNVQKARLRHQLECEALAVQAASGGRGRLEAYYDKAIVHLHARAMEGYVSWVEQIKKNRKLLEALLGEGNEKRFASDLFVEVLLLRVLESMSEQVLHAPEYVCALFHGIRWAAGEMELTLKEKPHFIIDYSQLHQGIEAMKRNANPYKGGVNFDDMNDLGLTGGVPDTGPDGVKKSYQESTSVMVVVDIISNFLPVFTFKIWLFFLSSYKYLGEDLRNGDDSHEAYGSLLFPFLPTHRRAYSLQLFVLVDSIVSFSLEFLIFVYGLKQKRLRWRGRGPWLFRHVSTMFVTSAGAVTMLMYNDIWYFDPMAKRQESMWNWEIKGSLDRCKNDPDQGFSFSFRGLTQGCGPLDNPRLMALSVCAGYFIIRFLVFFATTRPNGSPYIPGTPKARQRKIVKHHHNPLTADANVMLPGGDGGGSRVSMGGRPLLGADLEPGLQGDGVQMRSMSQIGSSHVSPGQKAPMNGSMNEPAEDDADEEIFDSNSGSRKLHLVRVFCWGSMLLCCFVFETNKIVPLCSEFDFQTFCESSCENGRYFRSQCMSCGAALCCIWILVAMTAFFDIYYFFYLGTAVFGYAMGEMRGLRNILQTALRHLDLGTGNAGKDKNLSRKQMSMQLTDGEAMKHVFGCSWRMMWSRIVEALYEDCLIKDEDANKMVNAAATVRWKNKEDRLTDVATHGEKFKELQFVMLAARDPNALSGLEIGRTRCISQLHLCTNQFDEPQSFEVLEHAVVEVELQNDNDRCEILRSCDENLKVERDIPKFKLFKGCELVSGGDVQGFNKLDLVDFFRNHLTEYPAQVVFQKPGLAFDKVRIQLPEASRVFSLSFSTSNDSPALDPVQWRVDGLLHGDPSGPEVWKSLVWQSDTYEPPMRRKAEIGVYFYAEYWRKQESGNSSHTVDLQHYLPLVHERLGFFTASLRGLLRGRKRYAIRPGIDTLLDSHVGNLPSLSQIIPFYGETVILSEKVLRDSDGVNTNLAFIISQFPEEWEIFSNKQQLEPEELYHSFVTGELSSWTSSAERSGNTQLLVDLKTLSMEIRMWASMRSQTVAKTIVGAMAYHEVIAMTPSVQTSNQPRAALEHVTELILAAQIYGSKSAPNELDENVRYLLERYKDRPFYLVFDYDRQKAKPSLTTLVNAFLRDQYKHESGIPFASVKARHRQSFVHGRRPPEESIEIVEILPRSYPLLVGSPGFMTQGKAGNQLGALRFARGYYLQMMDANMGAFLGEACKVPFVLRRFQPANTDRAVVQARIIGFREFIFTEHHGTVGAVMASAEWSFGTICQRFLAGLGARMHYGHPDFLDGFWACNRGSLSKASPAINLSEDIFAGFNVAMRGEQSKHVDSLAWEKGREASFNAASLFFVKVSKGNVGVMRSRDLRIITENLNIIDNFSFYFASIAFYLNNLLIDFSIVIYVMVFLLLTLAGKSLEEIGNLGSLLAQEWLMSMGIIAMAPRFMEMALEYGPLEGILRFIPSVPGTLAMFTFINKSIATGILETMITGEAHYIATGRPNANTHYSWKECYFLHCKSHYYPALFIIVSYLVYRQLTEEYNTSALPMFMVLASAVLWIIAPILFCPQPTLQTITKDLTEFWSFCIATPEWSVRKAARQKGTEAALKTGLNDPRSTLYEFWLLRELEDKKSGNLLKMMNLMIETALFLCVIGVIYSNMLDQMWTFVAFFSVHFLLMELWRLFYRPMIMLLLSMMVWVFGPTFILPNIPFLNYIFILIVLLQGLRVVKQYIQFLFWMCMRPNINWLDMPEADEQQRKAKLRARGWVLYYDVVVEYLFVNFVEHQRHLYCALFVLIVNLVTQGALIILEMLCGGHSWLLLNSRLRSRGLCARRSGFTPGDGRQRPPSKRLLQLSGESFS